MITYEVNLQVDEAIRADFLAWLRTHVGEMLGFEGFVEAGIEEVVEPAAPRDRFALCVRYRVRDEACLRAYFEQHAPRMRAEGIAVFGDAFSATRRILRSA